MPIVRRRFRAPSASVPLAGPAAARGCGQVFAIRDDEGRPIADLRLPGEIVGALTLYGTRSVPAFASGGSRTRLRVDVEDACLRVISGVPTFLTDDGEPIRGNDPLERALARAASDRAPGLR